MTAEFTPDSSPQFSNDDNYNYDYDYDYEDNQDNDNNWSNNDDNDNNNNNNSNNNNNNNNNNDDDDEDEDQGTNGATTLKLKEIIQKYYSQNSEICDKTDILTDMKAEQFGNLLIMTELINTYNAINDVAIYVSLSTNHIYIILYHVYVFLTDFVF